MNGAGAIIALVLLYWAGKAIGSVLQALGMIGRPSSPGPQRRSTDRPDGARRPEPARREVGLAEWLGIIERKGKR